MFNVPDGQHQTPPPRDWQTELTCRPFHLQDGYLPGMIVMVTVISDAESKLTRNKAPESRHRGEMLTATVNKDTLCIESHMEPRNSGTTQHH